MNVDAVRSELPVLERVAYLNTGTFGPLPRRTVEAQERWSRRALEDGRAGQEFFDEASELRAELRRRLGELIGAPEESMALTSSTTEGCNIVLAGLDLGPEDEIVTTDVEHPGLLGAVESSPAGVRVAAVRDRPAAEALEAVRAELTSRTRLIALSHVAWTSGSVLPVGALSGDGIPVLVDGAQSAGAIEVDVAELGCDFYTVSGQKWLLGPDATGALYVRREWVEKIRLVTPSYLSWEDPADLVAWPDARRFESGWIAPGSVAGLLASLDLADEAGTERFARARRLTQSCRDLVSGKAEVITESDQATLVSFRPEGDPAELVERLAAAGVVVRSLPRVPWLRASCGFWTVEEELERLAAGL